MTINNESGIGLEKYQINVEEFADSNLSFNFLVIEKFFDDPSKKKELLGKSVDDLYNEISNIKNDSEESNEDYLLKKYVLPGTSLIEAVFRILILNKNNPMTISEMEENLKKAWATVIYLKSYTNETISSMLNVTNEYFISQVD
tara:strand:- start:3989 stop:4420 length:432 start_codon:yes stop_codon:yes gene_type:complete